MDEGERRFKLEIPQHRLSWSNSGIVETASSCRSCTEVQGMAADRDLG